MEKIKYLIFTLIGLSLGFSSCNKNDSTPIYLPLPVIESFTPMMKEFIISDSQDLVPYSEHTYIVNAISELPESDIFGDKEFVDQDIDFSRYSLIIFYDLEFGKIESIRYRWGYATDIDKYQVSISYEIEKGSDIIDGEMVLATYVRGAMLVDKIPSNSEVIQMVGVQGVTPK